MKSSVEVQVDRNILLAERETFIKALDHHFTSHNWTQVVLTALELVAIDSRIEAYEHALEE